MKNVGVILAGGNSSRFNGSIPKQYMKLNGQQMIAYPINAFKNSTKVDIFIIVVDKREYESKYIERKYEVKCIKGGDTINKSIYNAIVYIKENIPECENVLFHEAARPFIKPDLIDAFFSDLECYDAVIATADINDNIGNIGQWVVDQDGYYLVQTPQAFKFNILSKSFSPSSMRPTIQQLPGDITVKKMFNPSNGMKITYPEDIFIAEQSIRYTYFKSKSLGAFDYSRLGKVLVLGGSGGVGSYLLAILAGNGVAYMAPSRLELNLENLTVDNLKKQMGAFEPDVIFNLAASVKYDHDGIVENFDTVFGVNVKANIVLVEYAKTLNKRLNMVLLSSSSSTRGRKNMTLYSASKAALNSVIESLAEPMYKKEIYINGIIPEKINMPSTIKKMANMPVYTSEMLEIDTVLEAILYYSVCDKYGELVHIRKGL